MPKLFKIFIHTLKCIRHTKNIQTRFYTRAITGDRVTELNEKTLTGRLLNYLERNKNESNIDNTEDILNILRKNDAANLKKYDTEQVLSAFNLIPNSECSKNRKEFLISLDLLDTELCRRLSQLDTTEILSVLHTFMNVIPQRIVEYRFYEDAVEMLFKKSSTLSKSDLVQFIFFLGLQKKTTRAQYMLRKCMNLLNEEFLNDLSCEELCIICNSTFKTSTKINNKLFLDKIVSYLNNNLSVLKDSAVFITLIKSIRHNRHQNDELLATISCSIFFNKTIDCYSFPALCHILALYSDFLYYDDTLIKVFTEKSIELLKSSNYTFKNAYLQEQPRAKDIKRFLWCLSNLNYKNLETDDIKNVIIPNIVKRLDGGEFESDAASLIEIALYLWMLNYRDPEIISYALTEQNIRNIKASVTPTNQRLNLLLTCMYYEDRNLYKKINIQPQKSAEYNVKPQLEKRPLLQKVFENLKLLPAKFDLNKYTMGCQVPHINIIGITGYKKKIYKAVHIEILDDYTCMKNTDSIPSGLMDLKLRILERSDEGIIVIRAKEVEAMSSEELSNLLEDELDLVC